MTEIAPFTFPVTDQLIRTVVIDDDPWFVATDVGAVLELGNPRSSLALLDEDEKGVHTVDATSGQRELAIVSEPGLYSLILRSRKPQARDFKRWITHDVLPAIRKTGTYSVTPREPSRLELIDLARDSELARLAEAERARLAEVRVAALEPSAEAWDTMATAHGDYSVADAAKLLSRNPGIRLGQQRLFTVLREFGWIYRQGADGRWRVMQTAVETGRLMELAATHYHPRTGELQLDAPQVRVTVKGLAELHRRLGGAEVVPSGRQLALFDRVAGSLS